MATAANLEQAAGQSQDNLFTLWLPQTNALRNALLAFMTDLLPVFPDGDVTGRPVANWLVLIGSLASQMPVGPPYDQLVTAVDYIYRCCWLSAGVFGPTPLPITNAQRAAVLASYNARF